MFTVTAVNLLLYYSAHKEHMYCGHGPLMLKTLCSNTYLYREYSFIIAFHIKLIMAVLSILTLSLLRKKILVL